MLSTLRTAPKTPQPSSFFHHQQDMQESFLVPDWRGDHPQAGTSSSTSKYAMGSKYDLTPASSGYRARNVFSGGYADKGGALIKSDDTRRAYDAPVMNEVLKVNHHKRLAAHYLTQAITSGSDPDKGKAKMDLWVKEEKEVAYSRVLLMNKCLHVLKPEDHMAMQVESSDSNTINTCVTYHRFSATHDCSNLNEIQDPISFATDIPFLEIYNLQKQSEEYCTDTIKKLYHSINRFCPKAAANVVLASLISQINEVEWEADIKITAGMGANEWVLPEATTRPYLSWESKPSGNVAGQHMVLIGPMDMNVCHEYDNPRVQNTIQAMFLWDASKSVQNFKTTDEPSDCMPLLTHIKINYNGENHILSFTPFSHNDHCIVSHMSITQGATDEALCKGILQMPDDLTTKSYKEMFRKFNGDYHCDPPLAHYCLGASRGVRWGEAQLAKVHSGVLAKIWFHGQNLPDPTDGGFLHKDHKEYPAARVVRFAFKQWDVMASSYMVGGEINTAITAVCYPPFLSHGYKGKKTDHVPQAPALVGPDLGVWEKQCGKDFYIKLMLGNEDTRDSRLYFSCPNDQNTNQYKQELLIQSRKIKGWISRHYTEQWDTGLSFFQNIKRQPQILDDYREAWMRCVISLILKTTIFTGNAPTFLEGVWWYSKNHNEKDFLVRAASLDVFQTDIPDPAAFVDAYMMQNGSGDYATDMYDPHATPAKNGTALEGNFNEENTGLEASHDAIPESPWTPSKREFVRNGDETPQDQLKRLLGQSPPRQGRYKYDSDDLLRDKKPHAFSRRQPDAWKPRATKTPWHPKDQSAPPRRTKPTFSFQSRHADAPVSTRVEPPKWEQMHERIRSMEAKLSKSGASETRGGAGR